MIYILAGARLFRSFSGKHISAIVIFPRKKKKEKVLTEKKIFFFASVRNLLVVF
jgi:hypothetical protein